MKTYSTILLFFAITLSGLLFSSCNESDDISGIFLDKQWKLTRILIDNGSSKSPIATHYWNGNEEAMKKSNELLNQKGNFVIQFAGFEENNKITGKNATYSGRATTVAISGNWSVDGESNTFSTTQQSVSDGDVLGTAFINALKNAYKYTGDYNNLQIYFKEGKDKYYLLLRVDE
ncbi:DUF4847 family protein [Bacteroides sp. 519]|uniref:DUF4847 family protein n=1 Tax=Bacteroides sp. 519 TaxID=2302937 RepID=UPI0013D8161A|nr:DUF4847 family protein [Bacteroides sp. 519]NDV59271.1 DUF4847 domain-containing protein [Bacteroides sp. 519]